ncbi:hypothetical protein AYY21_18145 [Photobacterium aquimaris]|nr:hypothetical protein AYY21_18145 [Photobacterium aquimaris]
MLVDVRQQRINSLVIQWSQYGEEKFGGTKGWLAKRIEAWFAQGGTVWFGLYSDPAYFKRIHTLSLSQQAEYLSHYFINIEKTYMHWKPWLTLHSASIQGFYLPLELSDYDFPTLQQRQQLTELLAKQVHNYNKPLMVSLYLSATIDESAIVQWVDQLTDAGIKVIVQDGHGTQALSEKVRQQYLSLLPSQSGIVREIFKQSSAMPFVAQRLIYSRYQQVMQQEVNRDTYYFSLRYAPFSQSVLKLAD